MWKQCATFRTAAEPTLACRLSNADFGAKFPFGCDVPHFAQPLSRDSEPVHGCLLLGKCLSYSPCTATAQTLYHPCTPVPTCSRHFACVEHMTHMCTALQCFVVLFRVPTGSCFLTAGCPSCDICSCHTRCMLRRRLCTQSKAKSAIPTGSVRAWTSSAAAKMPSPTQPFPCVEPQALYLPPPSFIPNPSSDMTDIVATSVGITDGEQSLMYHR